MEFRNKSYNIKIEEWRKSYLHCKSMYGYFVSRLYDNGFLSERVFNEDDIRMNAYREKNVDILYSSSGRLVLNYKALAILTKNENWNLVVSAEHYRRCLDSLEIMYNQVFYAEGKGDEESGSFRFYKDIRGNKCKDFYSPAEIMWVFTETFLNTESTMINKDLSKLYYEKGMEILGLDSSIPLVDEVGIELNYALVEDLFSCRLQNIGIIRDINDKIKEYLEVNAITSTFFEELIGYQVNIDDYVSDVVTTNGVEVVVRRKPSKGTPLIIGQTGLVSCKMANSNMMASITYFNNMGLDGNYRLFKGNAYRGWRVVYKSKGGVLAEKMPKDDDECDLEIYALSDVVHVSSLSELLESKQGKKFIKMLIYCEVNEPYSYEEYIKGVDNYEH